MNYCRLLNPAPPALSLSTGEPLQEELRLQNSAVPTSHTPTNSIAGGSIGVANVNEATLWLSSMGGNVEIGKVKASTAECRTQGLHQFIISSSYCILHTGPGSDSRPVDLNLSPVPLRASRNYYAASDRHGGHPNQHKEPGLKMQSLAMTDVLREGRSMPQAISMELKLYIQ